VLDEKMGEEVKITVIATGFRDQMPERRARMLSVEETPVVSVPVSSVPLRAPGNWMQESAPAFEPAPAPLRFLSEDEDRDHETARPHEPAQRAATMAVTYDHGALELAAAPAHNPTAGRRAANAGTAPFSAADEEAQGDLDTPAFLRTSRY
jgi:cell division protein FtsZ